MDRVLRNTAATVSVTFYNGGTAVEADGVVTVVAKKADGSTLLSTNATNDPAVGVYTLVIPAQVNLNILTLTWTGTFTGTSISIESTVEIVGGFYFSIAELRNYDSALQNTTRFPTDSLINARDQVEAEFEDICDRAFVPRFKREIGFEQDPDNYRIVLTKGELQKITSLKVNGVDKLTWVTNSLIMTETPTSNSLVFIGDATLFFSLSLPLYNFNPPVIEYEYGMTSVPIPIKQKALKRARMILMGQNSTIDERALTMTLPDIGTVNLATPGQRGSETGVPDIDVVLRRYTLGNTGAGVY